MTKAVNLTTPGGCSSLKVIGRCKETLGMKLVILAVLLDINFCLWMLQSGSTTPHYVFSFKNPSLPTRRLRFHHILLPLYDPTTISLQYVQRATATELSVCIIPFAHNACLQCQVLVLSTPEFQLALECSIKKSGKTWDKAINCM